MSDIEYEIMTIYTYMFSCYEYSKAITKKKRRKSGYGLKIGYKKKTKRSITRYTQRNKANRLRAFPQMFTYEY